MNNTDIAAHMALVDDYAWAKSNGVGARDGKHSRAAVEASARKLAAPEQAAPGFVMVPVEPTEAMVLAGYRCGGTQPGTRYRAMIEARPLTASPTAQPSVEPFDAFEGFAEHKTKETPYGPAASYKPVEPAPLTGWREGVEACIALADERAQGWDAARPPRDDVYGCMTQAAKDEARAIAARLRELLTCG